MLKLLQINICSNIYSTGKICEDIAKVAQRKGWLTYIAYGNSCRPSISKEYRIAGKWNKYLHYLENYFFDREGLSSRIPTTRLVRWINKISPDIILLHNLHDHYLNYPILFKYLAKFDRPVIWVQHDCWSYTGGCMYHDLYNCEKWRNGCKGECPNKRALIGNKSELQFLLKREFFSKVKDLTLVSVSDWLGDLLKQSFHKDRRIQTIHNGIDISRFKPFPKLPSDKKFKILGVAAVWDARKGLADFLKLRIILSDEYEITLVGLTQRQVEELPDGIKGITRTSNIKEMVRLYSDADVFVNPTYSDNFPTTNLEALACGTPVITYKTGGSPEAIDDNTGIVIKQGDIDSLAHAIVNLKDNPLSSELCRKRAERYFDKDKCFDEYIRLFETLLSHG